MDALSDLRFVEANHEFVLSYRVSPAARSTLRFCEIGRDTLEILKDSLGTSIATGTHC